MNEVDISYTQVEYILLVLNSVKMFVNTQSSFAFSNYPQVATHFCDFTLICRNSRNQYPRKYFTLRTVKCVISRRGQDGGLLGY